MARDVFGSGELSRARGLAGLQVAAFDETSLARSLLEGARTAGATGISTAARLPVILALLERVSARVEELEAAHAPRGAIDEERLAQQLLSRLAKVRRTGISDGPSNRVDTVLGSFGGSSNVVGCGSGGGGGGGITNKDALSSAGANAEAGAGVGAATGADTRSATCTEGAVESAATHGRNPRDHAAETVEQSMHLRAPPPGGYVVPRGVRVSFAVREDAVSSDDEIGGDNNVVTASQLFSAPLSRKQSGTKRRLPRTRAAAAPPDEDKSAGDVHAGEDVVEISALDDVGVGDNDVDGDHSADDFPGISRRGRASREELAAAAPVNDLDIDSYNERQTLFRENLRALCKTLRHNAADAARASGETSAEKIEAARDAAATKACIRSALGPGPAVALPGGLFAPHFIAGSLLPYQLEGLKWLARLRATNTGGILGDEMGLGKTVQIAALLGSLSASGARAPALVVCPATLVAHWVRELTQWWPPLRVLVLKSGSLLRDAAQRARVISEVLVRGDVLVTTYEGLRSHAAALSVDVRWGCVVLDEGHRIRNPDAAVTVAAKELQSVHRLILSGAPIQNSLRELWSLMDFCAPNRLGTLPVFEATFANPIAAGGWTHASALQMHTAYTCALTLRALVEPVLLRRLKRDVNTQLPSKTEQVLFCRLTPTQRAAYSAFLRGEEVSRVLDGREHAFKAITTLRKLANDPALLDGEDTGGSGGRAAAAAVARADSLERSGKLRVLAEVLALWHAEGRRCLVFSQGTSMLDIIEKLVRAARYSFLRMDGSTAVGSRQALVDSFNADRTRFVFLLTTRVGGVGVNLIGADRVLIFDPDWNPSTDLQARERAWRLGQRRHVTIYRLIAKGTIEEKVYARQVFKTALSARVLSDARARRLFNYKDLRELFTLGDDPPPQNHLEAAAGVVSGDAQRKTGAAAAVDTLVRGSGTVVGAENYDSEDNSGGSEHDESPDDAAGARKSRTAKRSRVKKNARRNGSDGDESDSGSVAGERHDAQLFRSVIDSRDGAASLAPSLDALSDNQRVAVIAHGARVSREALRALRPATAAPHPQSQPRLRADAPVPRVRSRAPGFVAFNCVTPEYAAALTFAPRVGLGSAGAAAHTVTLVRTGRHAAAESSLLGRSAPFCFTNMPARSAALSGLVANELLNLPTRITESACTTPAAPRATVRRAPRAESTATHALTPLVRLRARWAPDLFAEFAAANVTVAQFALAASTAGAAPRFERPTNGAPSASELLSRFRVMAKSVPAPRPSPPPAPDPNPLACTSDSRGRTFAGVLGYL